MKTLAQLVQASAPMHTASAVAHMGTSWNSASFRLRRPSADDRAVVLQHRKDARNVVVTLAHDDTYTVASVAFTENAAGLLDLLVIEERTGVYCESLADVVAEFAA